MIYVTKPIGPNSPAMETEFATGHKSSRSVEKNAKNRMFISETVIFWWFFKVFNSESADFEKNAFKDFIMFEDQTTLKNDFFRHLTYTKLSSREPATWSYKSRSLQNAQFILQSQRKCD